MRERGADAEAQSVKQRLLNLAQATGEPFNTMLVRYGIERLLYRLARSRHGGRFVVKGATGLAVWTGRMHRPTQDVDLLGHGSPDAESLAEVFRHVCATQVEPDGVTFDPASVSVEPIRKDAVYQGQRVVMQARLGTARIALQVDVGFGDAVTPAAREHTFTTLLGQAAPVLAVYPPETMTAEKLHAVVTLGMANSRMKDYFDLWTLATGRAFDGDLLCDALAATFSRRQTPIPQDVPVGLTDAFFLDAAKVRQWRALLGRVERSGGRAVAGGVEVDLATAGRLVAAFAVPAMRGTARAKKWDGAAGWR